MVLYINGKKAKSLYYNGKKIKEAWRNGVKVFSSEPYAPGTVFVNSAAPKTLTMELEPGVYYIDVTGGGATSTADNIIRWTYTQASAAGSCYGEFYLKEKATISMTAGLAEISSSDLTSYTQNKTAGICTINDSVFLTANPGSNVFENSSSTRILGGTASISSHSLIADISLKAVQGNHGILSSSIPANTYGASVSPFGWGAGNWVGNPRDITGPNNNFYLWQGLPGGIYLEYRRVEI